MRSTRALLLSTVVALLAGCATVRCPSEGGRPWREITTNHFVLMTDLGAQQARDEAASLERIRHVVLSTLGIPRDPPGRLPVVLFAGNRIFDFRRGDSDGFLSTRGEAMVVATSSRRGNEKFAELERTRVLAHEVAHYLVHSHLRVPNWISEGFAVHFETLRFDASGRTATLGHEAGDYLASLRWEHNLSPIEALWNWRYGQTSRRDTHGLYGSSWFWVTYLLMKERPRFDSLLARLRTGEDPRAAWDAVFPPNQSAALSAAVEREHRGSRIAWPVRTVEIPEDCCSVLAERALTPAEYHVLVARVARTQRPELSEEQVRARREAEFAEALRHDPDALLPNQMRQVYLEDPGATALARAMVRAHPDSAVAWNTLADVLDTGASKEERQCAGARAAALMGSDPTFHSYVATAYLLNNAVGERLAASFASPASDSIPIPAAHREVIGIIFKHATRGMDRCFVDARRKDLKGTAVLQFVIAPNGDVEEPKLTGESTLRDPSMEECLLARAHEMHFPPLLGLPLRVSFPLQFSANPE